MAFGKPYTNHHLSPEGEIFQGLVILRSISHEE